MIAALFLVASMQPASQSVLSDPEEIACYSENHSQKGVETCAKEALERAENSFRLFWRNTLPEYGNDNPRTTKLLKESQANWLKYRDAWCDVVAHDNHGALPMTVWTCKAKLTRERTAAVLDLIAGTNE